MNTRLNAAATPTRELLESLFRSAVAAAHPSRLPATEPAGTAAARTPRYPRRRQGRGLDDRSSGALLCAAAAAGAAGRSCGNATWLLAANAPHPGNRSRTPDPRQSGHLGDQAYARARRRGGRRRSCAGALVRRCFGKLDCACHGPHARREAGGDAGVAQKRRRDRRDQHGTQAPLAHQGRPARQARPSRQTRDARDLRCARRRSGCHRLRPHNARPDDARRRA